MQTVMGVSWDLLVQNLISGVLTGVLYALMALGVTFIFSVMRMINWAIGQFFMIGSFVQYLLIVTLLGSQFWYVWVLLSAAAVFALGYLLEPILIKPMFTGEVERPTDYATVVTIGLLLLFTSVASFLAGTTVRNPGPDLGTLTLGPLPVSGNSVAAALGALLALFALYQFAMRTWIGLALRASAQSRIAVQAAGINVFDIDKLAFALGVGLAGLAGALLAPVYLVYPGNGTIVTMKGFEIIIIGGLGSIRGTLVAAILLGLTEGLGSTFFSSGYQDVYGFLLLLGILIVRPRGLFGERLRYS